jgi:Divergent InlB B-repeat domain
VRRNGLRNATAACGRRFPSSVLLAPLLALIGILVLSSGAGAQPARDAAGVATVQVKFAALPWGTVTLSRPSAPDQQCNWDNGTDCTADVPVGDDVTLKATLDPAPNDLGNLKAQAQAFYGWSTPLCGSEPTCTLKNVSEAVQAYALFAPAVFEVRVTGAGTVESTGNFALTCESPDALGSQDCYEAFAPGNEFTLTAKPNNPGDAVQWVFGCAGEDANAPTCTTRTENRAVGVRFGTAVDPPQLPFDVRVALHVTKGGSGSGTVTGAGINCGSSCTANPALAFGTRVQLTATPASGSRFDGWVGGPCSSATTCTFNVGPVTGVRAVFAELPPPPAQPPPPPQPAQPPPPPAPAPANPPAPAAPPGESSSGQPAGPTKLVVRTARVTAHRNRGTYRIYADLISNKRANARLRVARGSTIFGERLVLIPSGRTTAWIQLPGTTRPGPVWLLIRLRDADGQTSTISRRITLAR